MPLSIPKLKFLVDENVRSELFVFLRAQSVNFKSVPKGLTDREVSVLSQIEERVLITNDYDFADYSKSKIYAVVLLRLPQNNSQLLISSFSKLLIGLQTFKGKLIILKENQWKKYNLGENSETEI